MKVIMYHYVRPFNPQLPNFKNLHIEDFQKQLDYFDREYGFVSKDDFINSFKTKKSPKGVVLTFDDGLKCHYQYVFKELVKRNLWGIFYVNTGPYTQQRLIDVHRIHLILGTSNSKEVYTYLSKLLIDNMLNSSRIKEFSEETYKSQINDNYTFLIKRILNYYIDYSYREIIIDKLLKKFVDTSLLSVEDFYMNIEELNQLNDYGMLLGSHTVNHFVMSKLDIQTQEFEIKNSFNTLSKILLNPLDLKTFCYPYGGFHTFTKQTEQLLDNNNCLFSFNVESRDVVDQDYIRAQALPRYDCNQFPFGNCR